MLAVGGIMSYMCEEWGSLFIVHYQPQNDFTMSGHPFLFVRCVLCLVKSSGTKVYWKCLLDF